MKGQPNRKTFSLQQKPTAWSMPINRSMTHSLSPMFPVYKAILWMHILDKQHVTRTGKFF